ncbi:MAG: cytochrome c bioproteinis protein [Parcubacteria group bacterium Gr01-1014_18]|nr:MAG: cytochrome c bioproteinis protein [Parcubacteria group bacterium Greene0416_36]TSC79762.1 MAG: cytochrome c bioproteinis protein [Parcubacteria group bacterium Gr01-1014_18]TSC97902.1 MAG: cytochrome c bioproteinis protein [Parcubacteria group bacterium Greene1014_20]TSD06022.1 MAG: cytochrome c bioproteinis protein [Parcubacteria group bacterium Greene0714_2]
MSDISLLFALSAGLVSFLSPCVLPLVPAFFAYLAGGAGDGKSTPTRSGTFLASLFFVLGFSSVFSLLGVLLNSLLSQFAYSVEEWGSRIGGVVIIFFGLYLAGLLRVGFLEKEWKFHPKIRFGSRYFSAFLFGAAFAAGWTPCVGAVLGSILALASTSPGSSFGLLFAYSVGLGIPFLILGLFGSSLTRYISRYASLLPWINRLFGVILIIMGVLVFTGNLSRLANVGLLNDFLLK